MKVKINLYFDGVNGVDWRISTKKDKVICGNIAGFSGEIESMYSFSTRKRAISNANKFCEMVGINEVEFFDKSGLDKPEISEQKSQHYAGYHLTGVSKKHFGGTDNMVAGGRVELHKASL